MRLKSRFMLLYILGELMISKIYKQKIPQGYSYVIKTSQIEEIIISNDIKTEIDLSYYRNHRWEKEDNLILETNFWRPRFLYEFKHFNIYVYPVKKNKSDIIRRQMSESVLPEFAEWMKEIENIEESSTLFYKSHYFKAKLKDDKVIIDRI